MTIISGRRVITTDAGVIAADDHRVTGTATSAFAMSLSEGASGGGLFDVIEAGNKTGTYAPDINDVARTLINLTATGNVAFAPTNWAEGSEIVLLFQQDGTGSCTLSVNDGSGAQSVTVGTDAGVTTIVRLYARTTSDLDVEVPGAGAAGPQGAAGANGNTILSGSGAPSAGDGANGDFWLRTSNSTLYGPKAAGSWPGSPVSLVGPTGATGATGATGSTGAAGSNGAISQIQDEGSNVTVRSTVNFTGAGVSVADSGSKTVVTIAGGGGGSGVDRLNGLAAPCDPRLIDSSVVIGTAQLYGCRVVIPKTGTLRDLYVYMTATAGNLRGIVYDTGQTTANVRTKLYDSGSVAAGSVGWQAIGDPNLSVAAGDNLDLAVECDNNTVSLARFAPMLGASQMILPTSFWPTSVTPKLNWAMAVYPLVFTDPGPATIAEGDLTNSAQNGSIFIMGRVV